MLIYCLVIRVIYFLKVKTGVVILVLFYFNVIKNRFNCRMHTDTGQKI